MDISELLSHFKNVTKTRSGWIASCPAHGDLNPSLAIAQGEADRKVLYCHAGCSWSEILAAANLTQSDVTGTREPPEAFYDYLDQSGRLLRRKLRYSGKRFFWQHPSGDGWASGAGSDAPVLYRLPEILVASTTSPVFLVEGERDADRLATAGLVSTSGPSGTKWNPALAGPLADHEVIIIPDNDAPGRRYAKTAAKSLIETASLVRLVELPDLPPGGDVSTYLDRGGTAEQLLTLAANTPSFTDEALPAVARARSAADACVSIGINADLFHTSPGEAWATIDGSRVVGVDSMEFRDWLRVRHRDENPNTVIRRTDLDDAIETLGSFARETRPERAVWNRVARLGGSWFFDVGATPGKCVEITPGCYKLTNVPEDVRFRRDKSQLPLPEPDFQGSLERDLKPLLDPIGEREFRSITYFLLGAVYGEGTYPALLLRGSAGSGKTMTTRMLRSILDPVAEGFAVTSLPSTRENFFVLAARNPILAFDNVSYIDEEIQDAACQILSGGETTRRRNYTNSENHTIRAKSAMVINSITDVVSRGDLLSRSFPVTLDPRPVYSTEQELLEAFNRRHPKILGALLVALAEGIAKYPTTSPVNTRLADLGRFVSACESTLGYPKGCFENDLAAAEDLKSTTEIENSVIGPVVLGYGRTNGQWVTPSDLFELLLTRVPENSRPRVGWPKTSATLVKELNRIKPALARQGVLVEDRKSNGVRQIRFQPVLPAKSESFEALLATAAEVG